MQGLRQEEVRGKTKEGGHRFFPPTGGKLKPTVLSEMRAKGKVEGWRRKWWERAATERWHCLYHNVQ